MDSPSNTDYQRIISQSDDILKNWQHDFYNFEVDKMWNNMYSLPVNRSLCFTDFVINPSEDTILGNGSYGVVISATHRSSGEKVALKIILPLENTAQCDAEIRNMILQAIHPNIMPVQGVVCGHDEVPDSELEKIIWKENGKTVLPPLSTLDEKSLAVHMSFAYAYVFPRMAFDLDFFVRAKTQSSSNGLGIIKIRELKLIFHSILSALSLMHRQNMCHLDVKPPNLLVSYDGIVQLTDFSICRQLELTLKKSMVATYGYQPPEVILGTGWLGIKVDVYSTAITMLELLVGKKIVSYSDDPQIKKLQQQNRQRAPGEKVEHDDKISLESQMFLLDAIFEFMEIPSDEKWEEMIENSEGTNNLQRYWKHIQSKRKKGSSGSNVSRSVDAFSDILSSLQSQHDPNNLVLYDFSDQNLGTDTARFERFLEVLKQCKECKGLDLSHNKLTTEHLIGIISALERCFGIFELDLSYNLIDQDGIVALDRFIKRRMYLSFVSVTGNPGHAIGTIMTLECNRNPWAHGKMKNNKIKQKFQSRISYAISREVEALRQGVTNCWFGQSSMKDVGPSYITSIYDDSRTKYSKLYGVKRAIAADYDHFLDLLSQMLHFDAEKRIEMVDALQHPFFSSATVSNMANTSLFAEDVRRLAEKYPPKLVKHKTESFSTRIFNVLAKGPCRSDLSDVSQQWFINNRSSQQLDRPKYGSLMVYSSSATATKSEPRDYHQSVGSNEEFGSEARSPGFVNSAGSRSENGSGSSCSATGSSAYRSDKEYGFSVPHGSQLNQHSDREKTPDVSSSFSLGTRSVASPLLLRGKMGTNSVDWEDDNGASLSQTKKSQVLVSSMDTTDLEGVETGCVDNLPSEHSSVLIKKPDVGIDPPLKPEFVPIVFTLKDDKKSSKSSGDENLIKKKEEKRQAFLNRRVDSQKKNPIGKIPKTIKKDVRQNKKSGFAAKRKL